MVIVSAGGVMIEFLADKVAALAPFETDTARALLEELRISRLLAGFRGQSPADIEAVIAQLVRFSHMVSTLGDSIAEIDVNPMICSASCAVAADCLVVPKKLD